ncbi:hypothetical protein V6N13_118278 [Hibiscus sabdariffa]|uniref:Uncharacterized protein n=1 Tax=Hibiscus sabdariffa TaxID=183260 RepID=A0ABR2Q8A0_9ROSI
MFELVSGQYCRPEVLIEFRVFQSWSSLVVTVESGNPAARFWRGTCSYDVELRKFMGGCTFFMSLDESKLAVACRLLSLEPWFSSKSY